MMELMYCGKYYKTKTAMKTETKLSSINFPCIMLERNDKVNFGVEHLTKFAICRSNTEITDRAEYFKNPVLCYYYEVVNEALRLEKIIKK